MSPDGYEDDDFDDRFEDEEEDDDGIGGNCSGWFDGEHFVCGAVGSEECDFSCNFRDWLGKTQPQIECEEEEQMAAQLKHEEWLKLRRFAP